MVHYELVNIIIDTPSLIEVILEIVVWHHGLHNPIVFNKGLLFILKFWSLLCYFLSIKKQLSTIFYPQTNDQTEQQNSIIKAHLRVFVHFKQNN